MSRESLGYFELLVLLAILSQGDEAYGVPIAHAIEHSTGKPVILASVTGQITTWIAAHGVIAVFALMAVDAVLPIGGELVMLFAGVIAAGVIGSSHPTLFGATLSPGVAAYLVLSIAGALGSLGGSLAGWSACSPAGRLASRLASWPARRRARATAPP